MSNGWFNESARHSLAKRTGYAGGKMSKTYLKAGKKLKMPSYAKKGKTYTIDGKKSTFLLLKKDKPKESKLRFTKENAERIRNEHKKYFGENYKIVKAENNLYKLEDIKPKEEKSASGKKTKSKVMRHIATKQERKKDPYLSKDSYVYDE